MVIVYSLDMYCCIVPVLHRPLIHFASVLISGHGLGNFGHIHGTLQRRDVLQVTKYLNLDSAAHAKRASYCFLVRCLIDMLASRKEVRLNFDVIPGAYIDKI